MKNGKERVMLLIDFIGVNFPSALYAIQQWSKYLKVSTEYEPFIGISAWASRLETMPTCQNLTVEEVIKTIKECCQGLPVVCWDEQVENTVSKILKDEGILCSPSYPVFSYGSIVNRGLLLANMVDCTYMVRVDPGTLPPEAHLFDTIFQEHILAIDKSNKVVSRSYEDRLSVRDDFLRGEKLRLNDQCDCLVCGNKVCPRSFECKKLKLNEQCELVTRMAGIDPRDQVTGGAMFTSRLPGIPAIPFEGNKTGSTLVWGSDDGRYQIYSKTEGSKNLSVKVENGKQKIIIPIPRFDTVGKPKGFIEYYRGLAGAVYLNSLKKADIKEFVDMLKGQEEESYKDGLLKHEICNMKEFTPENIAPLNFLEKIDEGYKNYDMLVGRWQEICDIIKKADLLAVIQFV